jgi:hypothetical protein
MMIAEGLAAISLVKASVDFIKSNIDTAKDIGEIAGAVDGLFKGRDEVQRARSKNAAKAGFGDQFGIQSVAQEVIDAKLAEEKLRETAQLIDMRFGPGTWAGILAERQKRIQEAKEARAAARRKAIQEYNEMMQLVQVIAIGVVVVVAFIAIVYVAWEMYS